MGHALRGGQASDQANSRWTQAGAGGKAQTDPEQGAVFDGPVSLRVMVLPAGPILTPVNLRTVQGRVSQCHSRTLG